MAYAALTAFLSDDFDPSTVGRVPDPEADARKWADKWHGMTADQLEAELIPICSHMDAYMGWAQNRIAELEAGLRAAIKSHDKIPANIPVPDWVESARTLLEGKSNA